MCDFVIIMVDSHYRKKGGHPNEDEAPYKCNVQWNKVHDSQAMYDISDSMLSMSATLT